jgi:aspartyl-tRNA(Asn)/glutamyl-tRNA(Gln) amidotransferase subunit A
MGDPTLLSVHQLSAQLVSGDVRSLDVVAGYLAKIKKKNSRLNAFVEIYEKDATDAAEAADKARRSGHAIGPLHGIPVALKDLIDIEGRIATGGSAIWRQRRGERTATLVRRLIAQGLVVIGKTQTVEFAMGGWGTNQKMGTPWNPWDPNTARTPGGSSSGSAVAVAAGLVPWAVGTDTGGSVRLPASWCGLTGLKTSIGRISTYGILPLSPTLDTPGPLTHCVKDATLLFCAMQGEDPLDPRTLPLPDSDPWPQLEKGVSELRLAKISDAERSLVAADVLKFYDESLEELARLGAEIAPFSTPRSLTELGRLNGQIMAAEGYEIYARFLDDRNLPLDEDVRPRLLAGKEMTAQAYLAVLRTREALKQEFKTAFASFDALLTPTTATTALPLQDVDQSTTPALFTRFVNFLDLCALSVPNGYTEKDLPTSLQIVCRNCEESSALRIGQAYQKVTNWHERRPPDR